MNIINMANGLASHNNTGNNIIVHFLHTYRSLLLFFSVATVMSIFSESMPQMFSIQEKSDWIIYNRYIQRDLELCKLLIDQELRSTKDNNEFAFYILVILMVKQ